MSCGFLLIVLCLFLTVSWVGMQCVIVALPGHTRLLLLYPEAIADGEQQGKSVL